MKDFRNSLFWIARYLGGVISLSPIVFTRASRPQKWYFTNLIIPQHHWCVDDPKTHAMSKKKHSRTLWGITIGQKNIHWPWFPSTAISLNCNRTEPNMTKCYQNHLWWIVWSAKDSFQVGWHDRFQCGSVPWGGWQTPFFSQDLLSSGRVPAPIAAPLMARKFASQKDHERL